MQKKPHDLYGSQVVSGCPLSKSKQQARESEMPANATHVVSRVGVQPDWNSVVFGHLGRMRRVWELGCVRIKNRDFEACVAVSSIAFRQMKRKANGQS